MKTNFRNGEKICRSRINAVVFTANLKFKFLQDDGAVMRKSSIRKLAISERRSQKSTWSAICSDTPAQLRGRMEKQENRNPECGTRTGQINEYFKLGSMIGINTPLPFSVIPHKMDDDTRSPFKKRHEYKEQ